ncbi:MAG: lactate utilization protein [Candidatus Omnitrophica bacterium]|nr:lactate utilization protein [Candidatus Omnitrophota bacterium]
MDQRIEPLIRNLQKRNIPAVYCSDKDSAALKVAAMVPQECTVGISGSVTLDQLGIVRRLEARGNQVFNQYKPGISRDENLLLRRQGASADYFLASANAISEKGELVFLSGYGNRTAGITYASAVIVVCGINKITATREEAFKRAREYATPLNCKRLGNWHTPCLADGICRQEICFPPEYRRMCAQVLVIEAEVVPERLKVVLVGENLGF